ncbi:hypothetical protein [Polymorphospora rubra]|nr:hypothetical protein [Polymorphospora rubra]
MSPLLITLLVVAVVLALCCVIGIIGALVSGGDDDDQVPAGSRPSAAAEVPAYTVVEQTDNGHITIEVESTKGLRAVFDDIRGKQSAEGGYWVWIDCASGGTESVANRLASGRFAIGTLGRAQTGLDEGEVAWEVNEGRSCPA